MAMVSLSWKTEKRKVSALIPYDKNPRRLTEAQAAQQKNNLNDEPSADNKSGDLFALGGHRSFFENFVGML